VIAISAVLVLVTGIISWLLLRDGQIGWGSWFCSALFGFALAGTTLAPNIHHGIADVASWVGHL
jgi:hypothetical protein